jgi:hypothetical protein
MVEADLLLLLSASASRSPDPRWARGYWPGKAFEYMGARRPVLCVPGDGGILDGLVRSARAGVTAADPGAVADVLEDAVRRRDRGEAIPYDPDRAVVDGFSRRRLAGVLASLLDRTAPAAGAAPAGRDA